MVRFVDVKLGDVLYDYCQGEYGRDYSTVYVNAVDEQAQQAIVYECGETRTYSKVQIEVLHSVPPSRSQTYNR